MEGTNGSIMCAVAELCIIIYSITFTVIFSSILLSTMPEIRAIISKELKLNK